MVNVWRIILLLSLLFSLVISCSTSTSYKDIKPPTTDFTPKENEEAELTALCLSGDIVAPDSLYNQILNELAAIRSTFGDDFEAINRIKFGPPWAAGFLMILFDDTTVQQVANGEYHAWDELNKKYQVTNIDTNLIDWIGLALLRFNGRLHPRRLAELYAVLPGMTSTGPSYRRVDTPNVYARQTEDGTTYLFRDAWGDCPSGCIYSEYWYFVFEGDQPVFIGHWAPHEESEEPDWWEEARLNREQYCGG